MRKIFVALVAAGAVLPIGFGGIALADVKKPATKTEIQYEKLTKIKKFPLKLKYKENADGPFEYNGPKNAFYINGIN